MHYQYPNVLASMALNFIYIDFWVSGEKLYAIIHDLCLIFFKFIFLNLQDRMTIVYYVN